MMSFSEIYRRAIPLGVANMSLVALVFTDMIMLGQHQLMEMAASSILMQAYLIILVLGEGLVLGFSPLYGKSLSLANPAPRYRTIVAVLGVLLLYALIGLMILANAGWLAGLVPQTTALARASETYILLLGLALLPNLLFILTWELLAFDERERVVLLGALLQFGVNMLANYTLIFGKFGFSEMGIVGAGIATLLSSTTGMLFLFLAFFLTGDRLQQLLSAAHAPMYELLAMAGKCVRTGLPIGVTMLVTIGFLSFSVFQMTKFGTAAVVAHNAVLQFNEMIVVFALGFGEFAAIRFASMAIASQADAQAALRRILLAASALFVPVLVLAFFFRGQIPGLFFNPDDSHFNEAAQRAMQFATLSIPSLIINLVLLIVQGALRGRGIVARPAFLISVFYWGLTVPITSALLFWFEVPPLTIWIGLLVGFLAATVSLLVFFTRTNLIGDVLEKDE
jgi:multidrug resistance protein, MATE family